MTTTYSHAVYRCSHILCAEISCRFFLSNINTDICVLLCLYICFAVSVCVLTSLWTGVWVQAGGPTEGCQRVWLGVTWGSWYPGNQTSCAAAPTPWLLPSRSQSDRSRLALATPLGRNLSERGGDGGEGGGWGLWPPLLGRPARGCGWAGRREASAVSS